MEFLERNIEELDLDDDSLKCIVCYMYELEGKGPERTCECGAQYHNLCLYNLFVNGFRINLRRTVECPACGVVRIHFYRELRVTAPI